MAEDSDVPEDIHATYVSLDFHLTSFDLQRREENPEYFPYSPYERDALGWYNLLRGMQDGRCLPQILSGKLHHLIDHSGFENDGLFCEWAYFVDFENQTLSIVSGGMFSEGVETTVAFKDLTLEWMRERRGQEDDETEEDEEDEEGSEEDGKGVDNVTDRVGKWQQDLLTKSDGNEVSSSVQEDERLEDERDGNHLEPDYHNSSSVESQVSTLGLVSTETSNTTFEAANPATIATVAPAGAVKSDHASTPSAMSKSRKRRLSFLDDVIIERGVRSSSFLSVLDGLGMTIIPVSPVEMDGLVHRTGGSATDEAGMVGMVGVGEGVEAGPGAQEGDFTSGGIERVTGANLETAKATKEEEGVHSKDQVDSRGSNKDETSVLKAKDTATPPAD